MTKVFVLKDGRGLPALLEKYAGSDFQLKRTEAGAPYLENCALKISLSHKDGILAVALSDKPVGVDIERINHKESHKKIAQRYFTSAENEYINGAERFFIVWTRKEALGKLLGTGLNSRVISVDVIKNHIEIGERDCFFNSVCDLLEGYCITCASEENCAEMASECTISSC